MASVGECLVHVPKTVFEARFDALTIKQQKGKDSNLPISKIWAC
jgi:hypothetical protein